LANNQSGIEGVKRIRDEFNTDFPAILLTGDTSPERLKLAQDSGLEVMHKPISGEKLKTALTKLAQR